MFIILKIIPIAKVNCDIFRPFEMRGSLHKARSFQSGAFIEIKRVVTLWPTPGDKTQRSQPAQVTKRICLLVSWAGFRFFWTKKDELKSIKRDEL
jgi:hypothetical protein